ncbi:hypothetical protein ACFZBE_40795 [Streptomyces sp. NPDC008061]
MTLVETWTRALIGAVFGPTKEGETDYARRVIPGRAGGLITM